MAIEVEGLRELNQAIRKSVDRDLPKRMGQANKAIGQRFISDWLDPKPNPAAVGTGAGAAVRPSASKREVLLRVGGAHRAGKTPQMQWGRRPVGGVGSKPPRPYIIRSAEKHQSEIEKAWLDAISDAMSSAFYKTS